jgi:undecaprenyl-diphosphatase
MDWEIAAIEYIGEWRSPFLDRVMIFLTELGSDTFTVLAAAAVLVVFLARKKYQAFWLFAAAFMGEELISAGIKYLVRRPRPEILSPLTDAYGYSFPSGHAFTAGVFYGILAYFLIRGAINKKVRLAIGVSAALLTFLVGFSRVYLGVHWPSDVLAGWAIAGIWLFLVIFIFKKKKN